MKEISKKETRIYLNNLRRIRIFQFELSIQFALFISLLVWYLISLTISVEFIGKNTPDPILFWPSIINAYNNLLILHGKHMAKWYVYSYYISIIIISITITFLITDIKNLKFDYSVHEIIHKKYYNIYLFAVISFIFGFFVLDRYDIGDRLRHSNPIIHGKIFFIRDILFLSFLSGLIIDFILILSGKSIIRTKNSGGDRFT